MGGLGPEARGTQTLCPRPNPPPSQPWVCASGQFYSQNTSSYIHQLYLNSNIVCVCPESQPRPYLRSPHPPPSRSTSHQCTPRALLIGPCPLGLPPHCPQKLQKPGKTLPEPVPLLLRPLPCSPVLPSECSPTPDFCRLHLCLHPCLHKHCTSAFSASFLLRQTNLRPWHWLFPLLDALPPDLHKALSHLLQGSAQMAPSQRCRLEWPHMKSSNPLLHI